MIDPRMAAGVALLAGVVGCGPAPAPAPTDQVAPPPLTGERLTAAPTDQVSPPPLTGERLTAGTYRMTLDRSVPAQFPSILITVPDGWHNVDGWAVNGGAPVSPTPDENDFNVAVGFWDVTTLYGHPCQSRGTLFDPGPTVDDLADAIVEIPLRDASVPIDVTVDGHRAKYIEWSVPANADFSACDTKDYVSWKARGWASERYHQGPGQVDRLWIVDLDGARLVIDAFSMPWSTPQDLAELEAVVDSIRFER